MSKDQVTAEAISKAVMHRITTGQFMPGDRLPSVRKMADEIGSNRNTVNKAYQILWDLGVIEGSESGRRGYTVRHVEGAGSVTKGALLDYFYHHSVELVWQGMAAGMSSDEMFEQLMGAVDTVFNHSVVRMVFFECNDYDTSEMGRRLNDALKMPVEYHNLSYFIKNPTLVLDKFDLIITTYHHLAEITALIQQLNFPKGKVVGIDTRMSVDSMLKIARFLNPRIGVVCTNQNTAHMLKHVLYGYHPEWNLEAISLEDMTDTQELLALSSNCDHFIVTHTCAEQVTALTGRTPDVVVNFQIDDQSLAFLNQRIHQIRLEKARTL